jgi:hypothetical protein
VVNDDVISEKEMIPFLTVISNNFEKDLAIVRHVLGQFEKRVHSENGYKLSDRAEMAAGWWFYDVFVTREFLQKIFQIALPLGSSHNKKTASFKIIDMIQDQLKKNSSEAKIKMHGDIPFAGPWWAWLMR